MTSPVNRSRPRPLLPLLLSLSIAGVLLNGCGREAPTSGAAHEHAETHEHRTYVCPMHPQVVRSEPGRCPICGMDLVEREAETEQPEAAAEAPSVTVSDTVVSQLGVRTAEVRRGTLTRHIEGFGLFLRTTVQGYRAAYHGPTPDANDRGASTSALLVQGQVFERQAPLLQVGQRVWVRVPGLGTQEWEGKLIGLESQVNQTTHTQVFHVSVAPEVAASVPPGMNANLTVEVAPLADALLVPRDAVIATGRGTRVMVALPGGRFEQREVESEDFGEDEIVIRSGLSEGERVVVSAQFLLDSEANLQAGLRRLAGGLPAERPAHEGVAHHEAMHHEAGQQAPMPGEGMHEEAAHGRADMDEAATHGEPMPAEPMPAEPMPGGVLEGVDAPARTADQQPEQEGATQ